MTVALGFTPRDFAKPPPASASWFPRRSAGAWWPAPGSAPSSRTAYPKARSLLRCFLGGMDDAGVLGESDEAVIAAVTRGTARDRRRHRAPALHAHHPLAALDGAVHGGPPARLAELEARLAEIPGLHVAGNAYQGIGIPDCIRMGKAAGGKKILSASSRR